MKGSRMVQASVRFPKPYYEKLKEFAKDQNMTLSDMFRAIVYNNFYTALNKIVYIDHNQGDEILKSSRDVLNELSRIRQEINRIGVNINQITKMSNVEKKIGKTTAVTNYEINEILTSSNPVDGEVIKDYLKQLDDISGKFGDDLCRIVELRTQ